MKRSAELYAPGTAEAPMLVLAAPLSFWGGIDAATGDIIDHSHPDRGKTVAGKVLVMPGARGSSSSSSVLAETIRRGTGPSGIVLARPDPILTVGAIMARALYGLCCPIVVCAIDGLYSGDRLRISAPEGSAAEIALLDRPAA
jgi:predicted aconitase with swiveling domain